MTIWAILPAAGIGRRMGSTTPKQYISINDTPIISCTLSRLADVKAIDKIIVVLHPDDHHFSRISPDITVLLGERVRCAMGGDERYQSVLNGLLHIAGEARADDWVLVHDAVRPCVRIADIESLIAELESHDVGGLLGSPVDNTLKLVDADNSVVSTVDRDSLWNALTPQMFRYGLLRTAIENVVNTNAVSTNVAKSKKAQVTDEASAIELLGHKPKMVLGEKDNIKITHESDLILASNILKAQAETA